MDRELQVPRPWIICVLFAVCKAVPIIKSEQLENVTFKGVDIRKGVQTTSILRETTRSENFDEEVVFMLFNKQGRNNGHADDGYRKKSELTDCQNHKTFTACVKLSLLDEIAKVFRLIKEVDAHSHSVDLSDGVESSRSNIHSELGLYDMWRDGVTSEGHQLQLLMVSGISNLLKNRSLRYRFFPGLTVNVLIGIIRPNIANVSVKLIQDDGNNNNNFVPADGRSMIEIQPWMLVPGALMAGLFPYMLLQIKMLVTSAMTFSNMVLWGAVFMTIRNFLFGNQPNGIVVYDNLGYTTEPPLPHNPGVRQPSPHEPASKVATRPPFPHHYPSEASFRLRQHHITT